MPQLIVFASMGLGEVILAEATLSYLGLGIKYLFRFLFFSISLVILRLRLEISRDSFADI